jgi:hypothetical protein
MNLHDLTGIPPSVKILDGEIARDNDVAIAGGVNSEIWKGRWFGQKHVSTASTLTGETGTYWYRLH